MKSVVIGATPNPSRYAYAAARLLKDQGHDLVLLGIRKGEIEGMPILQLNDKPSLPDVHTLTLYVGPAHQPPWYDYLLSLKPKRIIFNPGTENPAFEKLAKAQGIDTWEACTLVLLQTDQY